MFRICLFLLVFFVTACQVKHSSELNLMESSSVGDVLTLGEPVDMSLLQPLAVVISNPNAYVDQRVTMKGKIDKVCKKKGCWADIVSGNDTLRIKVSDDVIVIFFQLFFFILLK